MRPSLSHRDRFRITLPYNSRHTVSNEQVFIWRWKMIAVMSVIVLISIIYFFLYSPYFQLTNIDIAQSEFIPQAEIDNTVHDFLQRRRAFIFAQNNYFTFSKKKLQNRLMDEYQLDDIIIDTKAPNSLTLSFKEQIAVFLVHLENETNYRLVNHEGVVIQHISQEEAHPSLPKVLLNADEELSSPLAALVLGSWEIVNTQGTKFQIIDYTLTQNDTLMATTNTGFLVLMNPVTDTSRQLTNLKTLVLEFSKGESLPNEYIELRYGEKVYLK